MNSNHQLCPLCEEGNLHEEQEEIQISYKKSLINVQTKHSVCDCCEVEQLTTEQARQNKRASIAAKKHAEGLLTGKEVQALRKKLRLDQKTAAQLFGGGPKAFSKYENDDVMQSEAMDKLMRIALARPDALENLKSNAEINPKAKKYKNNFVNTITELGAHTVKIISTNSYASAGNQQHAYG